jgi:hypothetical protein
MHQSLDATQSVKRRLDRLICNRGVPCFATNCSEGPEAWTQTPLNNHRLPLFNCY